MDGPLHDESLAKRTPASVGAAPSGARQAAREWATRHLLARVQRGDRAARDEVVERHIPLACSLAARYSRTRAPSDDLVQVACVGLIKAVDRFDLSHECTFATFAVPTILGELRRHFRDMAWDMHLSRELQERALKVGEALRGLSEHLGRAPSSIEISEVTGFTPAQVTEALRAWAAFEITSLDQPIGDQDDGTIIDRIGAQDERLDLVEHAATIEPILKTLPERQRLVLHLRYAEDMTQHEIAERLGISQMHVSRLLCRSIEALRAGVLESAQQGSTSTPSKELLNGC